MTRTRIVTILIAAPVLLMAVGVGATEIWRWQRPNARLFIPPATYSLAEAVEQGADVLEVYQFLREGQDPNAPIVVRHPSLTGGRQVLVSPLLWAVATQRSDVVNMLLSFGARSDRAADRLAACLADTLGNAELAGVVRRYANGLPREQCPELTSAAPLLAVIEPTGAPDPGSPIPDPGSRVISR